MTHADPHTLLPVDPGPKAVVPGARVTMDRRHSLSGKRDLDWFFENKKWVRLPERKMIEAAWAMRELPEGTGSPLLILILTPKRVYKRAHDRNRIKRWIRESVQRTETFSELERIAIEQKKQLVLMFRSHSPRASISWDAVFEATQTIAQTLLKHLSR